MSSTVGAIASNLIRPWTDWILDDRMPAAEVEQRCLSRTQRSYYVTACGNYAPRPAGQPPTT